MWSIGPFRYLRCSMHLVTIWCVAKTPPGFLTCRLLRTVCRTPAETPEDSLVFSGSCHVPRVRPHTLSLSKCLLRFSWSHRLESREKLSMYNTVDDAVFLIRNAKHILILTGAGISKIFFRVISDDSRVLSKYCFQLVSRCVLWYS